MAKPQNQEYQIGNIVALKSHYTRGNESYLKDLSISGDEKSIPPFMMVTEILKETKNKFDEETGENTISKSSYRLKVIWFNAKNYEFNEKWINSDFVVRVEIKNTEQAPLKKGSQVILRTNQLEVKKKHISIKEDDWQTKLSKSSLLSFCAPEMVVIGKSKFKPKDPIFDKITNEEIRTIPKNQLKCQFYNPIADKYSEIILPVECFEIADLETDKLKELIKASEDESLLVAINDKLYQIKNVSYLHGIYMIQGIDFVDGTEESFLLNEIGSIDFLTVKDVIEEKLAPQWNKDRFISISQYLDLETESKSDKGKPNKRPIITGNLHYIHYKNLSGKFTKRFIKVKNVDGFSVKGKKEDDKFLKGYMVQAYCYLRKEDRTFTFTDERLLAIYDVNLERKATNRFNLKGLLDKYDIKNDKILNQHKSVY